jgi:hypothetical protein
LEKEEVEEHHHVVPLPGWICSAIVLTMVVGCAVFLYVVG